MVSRSVEAFIWGPVLWDFLFDVAAECDDGAKYAATLTVVSNLQHVIPCKQCRSHVEYFLQLRRPRTSGGAAEMVELLWQLKDSVNSRTRCVRRNLNEVRRQRAAFQQRLSDVALCELLVYCALCMDADRMPAMITTLSALKLLRPQAVPEIEIVSPSGDDTSHEHLVDLLLRHVSFMTFQPASRDRYSKHVHVSRDRSHSSRIATQGRLTKFA